MNIIETLDSLIQEYLGTLNNTIFDEAYCTQRMMADAELSLFLEWLKARNEH